MYSLALPWPRPRVLPSELLQPQGQCLPPPCSPPQCLLGKMVLYRSFEAWPGISRSSGLTKFGGIFWQGEDTNEQPNPLPRVLPPLFLVELGPGCWAPPSSYMWVWADGGQRRSVGPSPP